MPAIKVSSLLTFAGALFMSQVGYTGDSIMDSTYLVKEGNRPEIVFRVTLSPDGKTYMKEYALVFPKYRSADVPRYDPLALAEVQATAKTGDLGYCEFIAETD